jgi:hypothetical protein
MKNHPLIMLGRFGVLTLGVLAFAFQNLKAEDARDLEFFEKKIRPALVENCIKCHSEADKKVKGGLAREGDPLALRAVQGARAPYRKARLRAKDLDL